MTNKDKEQQVSAQKEEKELVVMLAERFGDNFEKWRKQHAPRKLSIIEVEDKVAILAPVTANVIAAYSMALVDPDKGMTVATRYLLEELWLDGDNEIREDEDYFIAAMLQVQNVIQMKTSRFTKL